MPLLPRTVQRIPVVAVLCALTFCLYGASPGKAIRLQCQIPPSLLSPSAHCQIDRGRRLGWLPPQGTTLDWTTFTLTSRLCDNTPRGGVRFCHRLTLVGDHQTLTLPEWRTSLTAAAVTQTLRDFRAGRGQPALSWSTPQSLTETLQTLLCGLLLAVTAWGFWGWQWPPQATSPWAVDGDLADGNEI